MSMLYLLLSMFTLPALDYVLTVPVQISLCPYSCSLLCLLLFRSEPVMSLLYLLLTMSLLFLHLTMSLFFLLLNGPLSLPLICFVFTLPVVSSSQCQSVELASRSETDSRNSKHSLVAKLILYNTVVILAKMHPSSAVVSPLHRVLFSNPITNCQLK